MSVSDEKCIACGTRYRPGNLDTSVSPAGMLDADGTFMGLPYWFCSEECYKKSIRKFLDKEWDFGAKPENNQDFIDRINNAIADFRAETGGGLLSNLFNPTAWKSEREYIQPEVDKALDAFNTRKEGAITGAEIELSMRLDAEWQHQLDEETEKREKETAKRQDELVKLSKEEKEREALQEAREEMLKPKLIPEKLRLEHTMILGPSGSGKTTKIQNDILRDFILPELDEDGCYSPNPSPPAYIIIDPKGLMVDRLARLDIYDNIVVIDPLDAPALNLFQKGGRDPAQLISDFSYIFSTTKQKLTGKQAVCFSFCARLLFTMPYANLETLLDLLDDRTNKKPPNPMFQEAISRLASIHRRFFDNDFYSANYASTREEIKARVYGVAQNDILAAMFNANTRKLDMSECIRERKIVLVNTQMSKLSEDHQTLGRYIIALVQDAIQSRTERHPVYLVIDEFQEFADPQKTPQLLRLIREYGGGAVLAFQNMYCAELDDDTRNAISTNTSIKYASSPEGRDLNYMARDMRCEPEFLKQIHKSDTHARFACYVRGIRLEHPFVVEEEFGWIDKWPQLTNEEYRELRASNKNALKDEAKSVVHADGSRGTHRSLTEAEPLCGDVYQPPEADRPMSPGPPQPATDDPGKPAPWKRS